MFYTANFLTIVLFCTNENTHCSSVFNQEDKRKAIESVWFFVRPYTRMFTSFRLYSKQKVCTG